MTTTTTQLKAGYLDPGRLLPGTEGQLLESFAGLIRWIDQGTGGLWSLDDILAHIRAAILAVCGGHCLSSEMFEEYDITLVESITQARDRIRSEAKCTMGQTAAMLFAILKDASQGINAKA